MKFSKQITPLVKIISTVPGLATVEDALPKPSSQFIPQWWKQTPLIQTTLTSFEQKSGNVKNCPSFPDYFSKGFIIPMWTDTILRYESDTDSWRWTVSFEEFRFAVHTKEQFLDSVPFNFLNTPAKFVFQAISPWRIVTPPGYSIYQIPLFYHFTNDFTVLPGIVDTDSNHEVNPQIVFLSDKTEFLIKRGTPLAQFIPFKRETQTLEVRDQNDTDKSYFREKTINFDTRFKGSKEYLKQRRAKGEHKL